MRVRWLLRAVNDLEDLHEYIALDNPKAAGKEVEKVVNSIGLLRNPYGFREPGNLLFLRVLTSSHIE